MFTRDSDGTPGPVEEFAGWLLDPAAALPLLDLLLEPVAAVPAVLDVGAGAVLGRNPNGSNVHLGYIRSPTTLT